LVLIHNVKTSMGGRDKKTFLAGHKKRIDSAL